MKNPEDERSIYGIYYNYGAQNIVPAGDINSISGQSGVRAYDDVSENFRQEGDSLAKICKRAHRSVRGHRVPNYVCNNDFVFYGVDKLDKNVTLYSDRTSYATLIWFLESWKSYYKKNI